MSSTKQAIIDFIAGSNSGIACVMVGQPLDTVKIKMQTYSSVYKNSISCFWKIFRTEGLRGLYAGTTPAIAASVMEHSALFLFYGQCIFLAFVLNPPELLKCRLQTARELHGSSTSM